jgi:hypothetical protein
MIITIILILSFLIAFNFLLLIFSCNKTTKKIEYKVLEARRKESTTLISNQLDTRQLAPTGS